MTTRVVNQYEEPYEVYIGRPSVWGNPYSFHSGTLAKNQVADRNAAIIAFRGYAKARLEDEPDWLEPLCDKVLGCFCKPQACHGDVIVELLDGKVR